MSTALILRLLAYNTLLLVADVAGLRALRRTPRARSWCGVIAVTGTAAIVLAGVLGMGSFSAFHLLACGLFLHGPAVLVGAAIMLWPARRGVAVGSALVGVLLTAVAVDAFLIEPTWLEVTHLELPSRKITRPLRLVVLADLQTDRVGRHERDVLRRVLDERPDVILLAGDYLQVANSDMGPLRDELHGLLERIEFPGRARAFAVRGNIDPQGWEDIFAGLDVSVAGRLRSFELGELRLTCLGLWDSRSTSLRIDNPTPDRYHVVLGHVPNFALGAIDADLLVAGHTHGGQVRLPWVGPLVTLSSIPRSWAAGLTELDEHRRLLVSRGVGMERHSAPRLRFLCRPELVVIDLVPADGKQRLTPDQLQNTHQLQDAAGKPAR